MITRRDWLSTAGVLGGAALVGRGNLLAQATEPPAPPHGAAHPATSTAATPVGPLINARGEVIGINAAILPAIAFALFSGSRQLVTGPDATIAALLAGTIPVAATLIAIALARRRLSSPVPEAVAGTAS